MEVAIDGLTHPRLADLRIELVAPDGNTTLLVPENTLTGANIANLVLADGGVPISGGTAPYGGRFAPAESLAALEGRVLNGTWNLRVTDTAGGQQGTLDGWGLDASKAWCSGIP